jgi:xanthine dehydrogenase YagS FAD-binding subunit
MMPNFQYVRPTTVAEVLTRLAAGGARLHAGGSDLLGCLREGILVPSSVVSLSGVAELRGIGELAGGELRIGATTTLTEIASHPLVRQRYPGLAQAALLVASPQLRNQGTLGGNLCQKPRCWYYRGSFQCARKGGDTCYAYAGENQYHCLFGGETCYYVHPSDLAPALVALEATAHILGRGGRRVVPLEQFFLLPGQDFQHETVLEDDEILAEVVLPAPRAGAASVYRKVRERGCWDFALVGVAVWLARSAGVVEQVRIVLSGVAAIPWRARAAERLLLGRKLDAALAARAGVAASEGAHPLAHNAYKVPMLRGLVEEALRSLA